MKKTISLLFIFVWMAVFMTSCGEAKKSSGNTQSKATTAVALGYSLEKLGLSIDSDSVHERNLNYQEADINGDCTEVYGKINSSEVSMIILQGFYKKDLETASVLVDNKTYTDQEMEMHKIYEDEKVIIYDMSNYLYSNTFQERIDDLPADEGGNAEQQENMWDSLDKIDQMIGVTDTHDENNGKASSIKSFNV